MTASISLNSNFKTSPKVYRKYTKFHGNNYPTSTLSRTWRTCHRFTIKTNVRGRLSRDKQTNVIYAFLIRKKNSINLLTTSRIKNCSPKNQTSLPKIYDPTHMQRITLPWKLYFYVGDCPANSIYPIFLELRMS